MKQSVLEILFVAADRGSLSLLFFPSEQASETSELDTALPQSLNTVPEILQAIELVGLPKISVLATMLEFSRSPFRASNTEDGPFSGHASTIKLDSDCDISIVL